MIKEFFISHPMHKKIVKHFDLFFILRPSLFFPVWIMLTSGIYSSTILINRDVYWITTININIILLFIGITLDYNKDNIRDN